MHDPYTSICDVDLFTSKLPLFTLWHKDPCTDGTDDSCGWFIRARHCDQKILEEVKSEFDFNFKHNYWFDKDGKQIFSTIGTLVQMYNSATWIYYGRAKGRKKHEKFMRKYLYDIIQFAENPIDCGGDSITGRWYKNNLLSTDRFSGFAGMIYSDILRKTRPWYKHPRWHIHHWRISWRINHWKIFQSRKPEEQAHCDQNLRDTV